MTACQVYVYNRLETKKKGDHMLYLVIAFGIFLIAVGLAFFNEGRRKKRNKEAEKQE